MYSKPLIVHIDGTIFLNNSMDPDGRLAQTLTEFTDLIKMPEGVYTFKLTSFSLWSAAAKGYVAAEVISFLKSYSHNKLGLYLEEKINYVMNQYRRLRLCESENYLALIAKDEKIIKDILSDKSISKLLVSKGIHNTLYFKMSDKIELKQLLFKIELYAIDETNKVGRSLDINFLRTTRSGKEFTLRDYQLEAAESYLDNNASVGGGGVVIMPPRSGKTCVGLKIVESLNMTTLIITENEVSSEKWKQEIVDKMDLSENSIELYKKEPHKVAPITITDYAYITSDRKAFDLLNSYEWGLVIFDDVHRLPAKTYIETANFESKHKLALAATLERSDNQGNMVYAVVGPKWYELLPQTLRTLGYLKSIECVEVKVPLSEKDKELYLYSEKNNLGNYKLREIAAFNAMKKEALNVLINPHKRTLIASFYKDLAKKISDEYNINYIGDESDLTTRLQVVEKFNKDEINSLIYTLLGVQFEFTNIDTLISVSYRQASTNEEYLRLGKLMEIDKCSEVAKFISIISTDTVEESDYRLRRKSLINYGFRFSIFDLADLQKGGVDS
ncbi:helicase-associated domain-containing protein [Alkalicella caledoniensis]|uniref:DNA 3'-5' helicase n=1 Tax=Alkalicella caledoniensis TaxID=2731377 RepID=A0A7G9W4A5_ALKCA|nr:helicase-associated domain-containing protein [Alkalicella caledoniensis]QNO13517.1 helicase-associated domain-containing protein [Alkalicella caledoniensis]